MKKVIIALLIALIVPACVFASRGLLDLTLGATAGYNQNIAAIGDGSLSTLTSENFKDSFVFGADVELKVWIADIDAKAFYAKVDDKSVLSGIASANIGFDILSLVRIKAGLGYNYTYNITDKIISFGNVNGGATKFENFKDACFDIHVGADVLLGPVTVGVYGTLPTATSVENGDWGGVFSTAFDSWKNANVGVTVGFALL